MNLQVTEADAEQLWCSSVDGVVSAWFLCFVAALMPSLV